MGGIFWALRWLAAILILANCLMLPVDAALESRHEELQIKHSARLVAVR